MLIWGLVAMKFSTTPMTPWSSARVVQVMVFWWPLARQLSMGRFGENQNVQQWMVIEIDFTRFYWEFYWILLDYTGNFTGFLLDFYWLRRVRVGKIFNRHGMIPKGLSSVSLDPNIWETPHVFRPKKYHHFCHFCTTEVPTWTQDRRCPRPPSQLVLRRSLWHHMLQRFKELTP